MDQTTGYVDVSSFIDSDTQVFEARYGLGRGAPAQRRTGRRQNLLFCSQLHTATITRGR